MIWSPPKVLVYDSDDEVAGKRDATTSSERDSDVLGLFPASATGVITDW
jgi:hypothetical protein